MDQARIIDVLGLPPEGSLTITAMEMMQWGSDLVFHIQYTLSPVPGIDEPPAAFRLLFRDCREIRFRVYAHIAQYEVGYVTPTADIAELRLGQGGHRKDAHLLTSTFGLTVSYGTAEVRLEDSDTPYPL